MASNNSPFKPKQIYINPDKLETIEPKLPPMPVIAKTQTTYTVPTQSGNQDEISNLENQIAAAQVEADDKFKRSPEEEELKALTLKKLLSEVGRDIQEPRYLTIQDFFKKYDKDEDIPDFRGFNPNINRALNSMFGTKVFNPRTGKVEDLGEEAIRREEAQMQADRERAYDLRKEQNKLGANIYNIMNGIDTEAMREDRFNRQMAQQNEQFYQSLGQRAAENAAKIQADREALQRQMEQQNYLNDMKQKEFELAEKRLELEREKAGLGGSGANGANPINKMPAADKKALTENNTTIKNIEAAMQALEENPNAYTWLKGKLGADIANRIDPKGVKTRTQIDNITAVYRKWLTGAQMSDKERLAYERFLPAPSDNYNIVKAKLQGMKESIERSNQALLDNYGMTPQANTVNSGFTQMKAPNGKIYNVPNDKVEEMKQKGGVVI